MKKRILLITIAVLCCALCLAFLIPGRKSLSSERKRTLSTVKKLSDYADGLNLYSMEVFYDYDLDNLTPVGPYSDQRMLELILKEAMPGMSVQMQAPMFGCTAFSFRAADGKTYMGRNYDFLQDTSAMMCYCHPKDGYASVCFSALSNLGFSDPMAKEEDLVACLAAPLIPLDGMNEKGVCIAVLTLKSEPTAQDTGKPVIATPVLIRTVLDRAATTEEAIELITGYDFFAASGIDYHFYISDASGNGVVVEWDCGKSDRPMVVTSVRTVTNFYAMYENMFAPGQDVGEYGVGKLRHDKAEAVLEAAGEDSDKQTAWEACMAAASTPKADSLVSNTQWTVIYDLTDLTHEFTLHRHWGDVFAFDILQKSAQKES